MMVDILSRLCYVGGIILIILGIMHIIYIIIMYRLRFNNLFEFLGDMAPAFVAFAGALRGFEASGYMSDLHNWRNTINLFTAISVVILVYFGLKYGRWSRFRKQ